MQIPDCYEADRQAEAQDLAHTAMIMRRPRCERCDTPILSESYLDLSPFGLNGLVCEHCVKANTHATCDLED